MHVDDQQPAVSSEERSEEILENTPIPADWSEEHSSTPEADTETVPAKRRGVRPRQLLTGSILSHDSFTRRLPLVVYIVFLMLLYIANGFRVQHKHNEFDDLTVELKRLKTIAVTTTAVRMTSTRQSEIERMLRERNIPLSAATTPPRIIERPDEP